MLVELHIRDLALIEDAQLSFGPGLNVITGETGAGKSLLVGALELLSGARPRGSAKGWVRDGAERARVEGQFLVPAGDAADRIRAWLRAELPDIAEELDEESPEGELEMIVGRTLTAEGRTRAHVNQRPIPMKKLRGIVGQLLEIHGQNDHQHLLEPVEQLRLVDAFGELGARVDRYRELRARWLELAERVARKAEEERDRRDRLELVRFQHAELVEADVGGGEAGELVAERDVLRHAGELARDLGGLVEQLTESDDAVIDALRRAERVASTWAERVSGLGDASEELRAATVHLEEGAAALSSFLDGVEADPRRLEELEERLELVERLARKHGVKPAELGERRDVLADEIEQLEAEQEDASKLEEQLAAARSEMASHAERLGKARRALRKRLPKSVREVLAELGLAKAEVELAIEPRGGAGSPNAAPPDDPMEADRARFGPHGADDIELLLAANPGEPPRPLRHVASGGEAARIMLALRTVLAACDAGRTLVFDEVDAGVGGRLGPAVGGHLAALGQHHQVLCVTHLPAIAACAARHMRVAKQVKRGRTRTTVELLSGAAREAEVADMIAGGADEGTARAEARRLLKAAGGGASSSG